MVRKAVADFLAGPTLGLGQNAAEKHQEITRFVQEFAPLEEYPIEKAKEVPVRSYKHVPISIWRIFFVFVSSYFRLMSPRFRSGALVNFNDGGAYAYHVGSHDFIKPNSSKKDQYNIFRLNRWLLLKENILAYATAFQFVLGRRSALRKWADAKAKLTSRENWKSIFDHSDPKIR